MKKISHCCHIAAKSLLFYLLTLTIITPAFSSGDILVTGNLIAEPCTLEAENADITVDFDTVIDKYLYLNRATKPEMFQILLTDCDVSVVGSGVSVTFRGVENSNLNGYLALDAGSVATHVAIGIQDSNGLLIPINTPTQVYPLTEPTTALIFQGIVEGEPDAIRSKTIGLGPFAATATFILEYE